MEKVLKEKYNKDIPEIVKHCICSDKHYINYDLSICYGCIGFRNGVFDLENRVFSDYNSRFFVLSKLDFDFNDLEIDELDMYLDRLIPENKNLFLKRILDSIKKPVGNDRTFIINVHNPDFEAVNDFLHMLQLLFSKLNLEIEIVFDGSIFKCSKIVVCFNNQIYGCEINITERNFINENMFLKLLLNRYL